MARPRLYADNAAKQAAYKERLRERERQRQAEARRIREHRANIEALVMRDIAEELGLRSQYYHHFRSQDINEEDNKIARQALQQLAREIKHRRVL